MSGQQQLLLGTGVSAAANYIEDVFSTWLYTGNGSTQTITNGIDLSTKGGLVWVKSRNGVSVSHHLADSARGVNNTLFTNTTGAQVFATNRFTSFNSNGFSLGNSAGVNAAENYASWTFRKQPKFFDVVTWSGQNTNKTIAHNLGTTPGCIIIKRTSGVSDWVVWHRSLTNYTYNMYLNTTAAQASIGYMTSAPDANNFYLIGGETDVNLNGQTYVAYLFAHDAGGFGLTGTDNVITCGSFTTDGSGNATVSLGYEPQWVLIKRTNGAQNWLLNDVMRGMSLGQTSSNVLFPNTSDAEYTAWSASPVLPNATGFVANGSGSGGLSASANFIYIAIRRGPMRTPTTGTSVFSAKTYNGTTTSAEVTHDVTFDAEWSANRDITQDKFLFVDALRGINGVTLITNSTGAETSYPTYWSRKSQRTMYAPSQFDGWWAANSGTNSHISYGLVRAPGFFDVVCFTAGTSTNRRVDHNLTTAPQLILLKARNVAQSWYAYSEALGINGILYPNQNWAQGTVTNAWGSSAPTATNFGINEPVFASAGDTYVAYLFASCPGVSKVGSYTGTGTTQQIDCGFTGGARFVLIKRADSTGDWYVWDSARGIVAGNDPYLLLNSTAAEVTNTDFVDTFSSGFEISSTAPAAINANGGTFIFLAIA